MRVRIFSAIILIHFFVQVFAQTEGYSANSNNVASLTSHLPIVMIETNGQSIPNEPKITVNLKIIDNGSGMLNSTTDPANQYDGWAGIEIRGQSSQNLYLKKSYGFELRDSQGEDLKVSLLGMPAESDWVLYGPYSDKTLLRNALTYYLGRKLGRWQAGFRFCEVILNNSYIGIYQLTEKIKRDKNRVNITKIESADISGDELTGGYIVKVDKIQDLTSSEYFYNIPDIPYSNARYYAWTWVYPKAENLVVQQRSWFMNYIKTVENTINGSSFSNMDDGYPKYLDVASFIDFQIMNELGNNVDGYRYSTFFYKDRDSKGGKLCAGPLWDFDLCYGNVNYSPGNLAVDQWAYLNWGPYEKNCMHWWARFMQDPAYVQAVKQRWSLLRKGPLQTDSILGYIDAQVNWLGEAINRNFVQWPILGIYVWPNSAVRYTYSAEIDFLKDWITRRLAWMDSQWLLNTNTRLSLPEDENIQVYPNPVSELLNIKLPEDHPGYSLSLYDIRGKEIPIKTVEKNSSGVWRIDVSGLQDGIYLLSFRKPGAPPVVRKIVKTGN